MKKKLTIALALLALVISGCANYQIRGTLHTPFGSVSSDGKSLTIEADTRGFAK
jgi:hypothetical protein